MTAPTHKEVRRAIVELDAYLDRLYRRISHAGKTYGVFSYQPDGLGLGLKLSKDYCDLFHDTIMTGDFRLTAFKECIWPGLMWNAAEITVDSDTGEKWSAWVTFKYYRYLYACDVPFPDNLAKFYVVMEPDADDPRRMKWTIRKEGWFMDDVTGDLCYLNTPIMKDVKAQPDGTQVNVTTNPWETTHPNNYTYIYATIPMAYYWWYNRPTHREKVKKEIVPFLDDYNLIHDATIVPHAGINEIPDDIFCNKLAFGFIPPEVYNLPRGLGYMTGPDMDYGCCREHFAGLHVPFKADCMVCWYYKYKYGTGCYAGLCHTRTTLLSAAANKALYLMRKYKDPYKEDADGNSAYDILINGWTDGCGVSAPGLITYWEPGKGLWIPQAGVHSTLHGFAFLAFTVLGYGFEVKEAKEVADDLASVSIKVQWGYPWTSDYVGAVGCKGWWLAPDGTLTLINRPNHRGGMRYHWIWIDDKPVSKGITIGEAERFKEEFLKWNWAGEPCGFAPTSFENSLPTAKALRVYEAYKYRLG